MKALTYIEIDVDFCSRVYGESPCEAKQGIAADTYWSASRIGINLELLEGGSRARKTLTTGAEVVFSDKPLAGFRVFDVEVVTASGSNSIGVANLAALSNVFVGGSGSGGYRTTGAVGINNVTVATLPTYTTGDTIRVAVNLKTKRIWFRKLSAPLWNNDAEASPFTGKGGFSLEALGDLNGLVAAVSLTNVNASVRLPLVTGSKKCFNSLKTCQDRLNFDNQPKTLRFAMPTDYLPREITCTPSLRSLSFTPAVLSLGGDLGQRATLTAAFEEHRHPDTGDGLDPYRLERAYIAFDQGSFWSKFRSRQPFLQGRSLRVIQGLLGQPLSEMFTRHYVIESFDGPSPEGVYTIKAKDILKLADNDRAQAPAISNGFLVAAIDDNDLLLTLSPAGVGDFEYDETGYLAIGGTEIVAFNRPGSVDDDTIALYHLNEPDGSNNFIDSSFYGQVLTGVANAQIDGATSKFGTGALVTSNPGDYVFFDGRADFAFGTGDFTIEMWVRLSASGSRQYLYDSRPLGVVEGPYLTISFSPTLRITEVIVNGVVLIEGLPFGLSSNFEHLALCRKNGMLSLYENGVAFNAPVADTTDYLNGPQRPTLNISGIALSETLQGRLDEIRISRVARYSSDFKVATAAFGGTGDVVSIERGALGTTAVAHSQQDRVQSVITYFGKDPADIIYDLFTRYAGVPLEYIDLAAWKQETAFYLQRLYTATIADPVGVNKLISELIEQAALVIWWDDEQRKIQLRVIRAVSSTAAVFDGRNTIEGSLSLSDQPDKRLSQVWTYFGQINPLKNLDDRDNYRSAAATVDLQAQSDYGAPAIRKIFSRWIPAFGRSVALKLNDLILSRFRDPPRRVSFELFRRGSEVIRLGDGYRVGSWVLQNDEGELVNTPVQITRLNPGDDRYQVEAEEMVAVVSDPIDLNNRILIIDSNTLNFDLRSAHDSIYPPIIDPMGITVRCIIEAGVVVGSFSTSVPSFDVGNWPIGLSVTVELNGRIQGRGGNGGKGGLTGPGNGAKGGKALYTRFPVTLDFGEDGGVWGGGGGGGGASSADSSGSLYGAGGGGGGAGSDVGLGGDDYGNADDGSPGTFLNGGNGGNGPRDGGDGGNPGQGGGDGENGRASGGDGGNPGESIDGASFVTVTGAPDIRGPQIN